jgi:hypothetical protein
VSVCECRFLFPPFLLAYYFIFIPIFLSVEFLHLLLPVIFLTQTTPAKLCWGPGLEEEEQEVERADMIWVATKTTDISPRPAPIAMDRNPGSAGPVAVVRGRTESLLVHGPANLSEPGITEEFP